MEAAVYDEIGKTYDLTRRADPSLIEKLITLLGVPKGARILDVGCGSGNYTIALANAGFNVTGLDISQDMLAKAKKKDPAICWVHGDVCDLPFPSDSFDCVTLMLCTHHFHDLRKGLSEACRVARKVLIFTSTPEQMDTYWLKYYFPQMIEAGKNKMTSAETLKDVLRCARFTKTESVPFFVTPHLEDLFLQSGKYRPEIYLDAAVRDGISSFHQSAEPTELKNGLKKLENDIQTGEINRIIQKFESNIGDYLFIVASRKD